MRAPKHHARRGGRGRSGGAGPGRGVCLGVRAAPMKADRMIHMNPYQTALPANTGSAISTTTPNARTGAKTSTNAVTACSIS